MVEQERDHGCAEAVGQQQQILAVLVRGLHADDRFGSGEEYPGRIVIQIRRIRPVVGIELFSAVAAADGTVAPARWQGDLDMSCANIFVDGYERIKDGASRKVLVVDGEMTGSQFKSREPEGGPWRWVRRGNEWLLFYSTGSLIIFR